MERKKMGFAYFTQPTLFVLLFLVTGVIWGQIKKELTLPAFNKSPYRQIFEGPNGTRFHEEWGKMTSLIYSSGRDFVAVFSNVDGTYKYAEWKHCERGQWLVSGYVYKNKRFEFDKKQLADEDSVRCR